MHDDPTLQANSMAWSQEPADDQPQPMTKEEFAQWIDDMLEPISAGQAKKTASTHHSWGTATKTAISVVLVSSVAATALVAPAYLAAAAALIAAALIAAMVVTR